MKVENNSINLQINNNSSKKLNMFIMFFLSLAFIVLSLQLPNKDLVCFFAGALLFWQRYLTLELAELKDKNK